MPDRVDQLPLCGGNSIRVFCDRAEDSENAKRSHIVKIDLYKDRRIIEWWRHELLVFTIVHSDQKKRSFLAFERGRLEDDSQWFPGLKFVIAGFQGKTEDTMEFFDDIRKMIDYSARVLEIEIKPNAFSLFTLATIIKKGPYYGGYSNYHLFSANCWSWARGLTLDIALHQHKAIEVARLGIGQVDEGAPMSAEELQVCMLTQYGAWGGLLLRLTAKMEATSGRAANSSDNERKWFETVYTILDYRVKRLRFIFVRLVLYVYTVLGLFSRYRELLLGPLHWVTSFRRLTVHHDKALDDQGRDITHLPEGPNFRGFLPSRPILDPILIQGLYIPGRYPLAFVSLTLGSAVTVSSIHTYVSTAFSDGASAHPFIRRDGAVKCSIMRKAENGSLIEVGSPRHMELRAASPRRGSGVAGTSPQYYSGITRIDGGDEFAERIQSGDTIVLWAEGRLGQAQYPRYASMRVITKKPKFGSMDFGFLAGFSFRAGALYQYLNLPPIIVVAMLTTYHLIGTSIENWAWSNLTKVANILVTTSVPLPLPPDGNTILDFTLPDFISHCEKAEQTILCSPLKSVLLKQGKARDITLAVQFEHAGVGYLMEIVVPSPKFDLWHYLSFMTAFHRLERDTVTLSRRPAEGTLADIGDPAELSVKILFKPDATATFATVVNLLRKVENRYWFHFWNNAKEWSWPWWFLRSIASPLNQEAIDLVQLGGDRKVYSLEDASALLSRNSDQWMSACSHEYGKDVLKDVAFVVTRTRAIYLVILFFILQQMLSPFINRMLNALLSLTLRCVAWPLRVLGVAHYVGLS